MCCARWCELLLLYDRERPGSNWRFLSNTFLIVPNSLIITGAILILTFHTLLTSISRSLYVLRFSVSFVYYYCHNHYCHYYLSRLWKVFPIIYLKQTMFLRYTLHYVASNLQVRRMVSTCKALSHYYYYYYYYYHHHNHLHYFVKSKGCG